GGRERIEPGPREGGGLADHPVGRLRAERELEADLPVFGRRLAGEVGRAQARWPRVARVVAVEEPEVRRPGRACGVVGRGPEADERGVAFAREDTGVEALHPTEVRQVEDVVV